MGKMEKKKAWLYHLTLNGDRVTYAKVERIKRRTNIGYPHPKNIAKKMTKAPMTLSIPSILG